MRKLSIAALGGIVLLSQSANAGHFVGYHATATDKAIEDIGTVVQLALPLSGLIYSMAIGDYEGSWQVTEATAATAATTQLLKIATNEERPYQPEGYGGRTFPSGHTSFAFAGAAFWQRRYGWYIGAPMYAAATFVGYSRVRAKMHNVTDVVVGAALGIGFNYLFTTRYKGDTQVSITPTDGGAQLRFNTTF